MVYIPERDWICSRIPIVPKAKWICFRERTYSNDIHSVLSSHVETVTLLSKLDSAEYVKIDISMNEFDVTKAEMKSTYSNIKQYVLENFGQKVSSLYISQVKKMCGLEVGENYNLSKKENNRVPTCPPHKVEAIMDAFKYFKLI